jgi:flagellar biosynthesis protein FlhF
VNIKTFQAGSMAEALQLVKQQMGRDAVILHTRTLRRRGWLGIGGRQVVEVTASNDVSILPPKQRRKIDATPEPNRPAARSPLLNRTYGISDPPAPKPKPRQAPLPPSTAKMPDPVVSNRLTQPLEPTPAPPSPSTEADVSRELRQVRDLVMRVVRQTTTDQPQLPEKLFEQYLAMIEHEVSQELAEQIIQEVMQASSPEDQQDGTLVRQRVRAALAGRIPVDEGVERCAGRAADGRPRTIALIGPTGVGKTTTLAKLAATFKLRDGLNVGLITIDTYRIAAVDQLKTYAEIIDLPLEVVLTPTEMGAALKRLDRCDVILIDTAGRGQRDAEKLKQLRAFIDTAAPHEVHLVLACTSNQTVMMDAVEKFSEIPHDRIIFTKLDEAVGLGVLLNVVERVDKRLSYVTTGQEVPHQIEPGRSDRLADLILGGEV